MRMAEEVLQLLMLSWIHKRRRSRRRYWVHRINQKRDTYGEYHHLMAEILSDEEKCLKYIRMRPSTFQLLLDKIGPYIEKRTTNFRKPLSAKERLIITLRYLASEESHVSLSFHFRAGVSTIRSITTETCRAIWDVLQKKVMPIPDKDLWLKIANEFTERFQFPNCLGAIDGKHIRIKKPNKSGSMYFNYKEYFSIVLLAVVDAEGKFIVVDVGSCGSNSDGGVFSRSEVGKKLLADKLDLPQDTDSDTTLPFAFVADDTFPLRGNLMKPFPNRQLAHEKELFNYRLSRARNSVECSFGRISQMWRILLRQMDEQPESATDAVKAITVLHNFIIMQEPGRSVLRHIEDDVVEPRAGLPTFDILEVTRSRATKSGMEVRNAFMRYFSSSQGALPWQNSKCYNV